MKDFWGLLQLMIFKPEVFLRKALDENKILVVFAITTISQTIPVIAQTTSHFGSIVISPVEVVALIMIPIFLTFLKNVFFVICLTFFLITFLMATTPSRISLRQLLSIVVYSSILFAVADILTLLAGILITAINSEPIFYQSEIVSVCTIFNCSQLPEVVHKILGKFNIFSLYFCSLTGLGISIASRAQLLVSIIISFTAWSGFILLQLYIREIFFSLY